MPGPASIIDDGVTEADHAEATTQSLNWLQRALTDRWRETFVTAVRADSPLPRPYSAYGDRYTPPDLHRNAGMAAHFSLGQCEMLAWYDGGMDGSMPSSCHGRTAPEGVSEFRTYDYQGWPEEIPLTVTCCMGELLVLAEDIAWNTREVVRGKLPPFASQSVTKLKTAREGFAKIATGLGLAGEESDELNTGEQTIPGFVQFLGNGGGNASEEWMADWTGLAATSASEGYLASTVPTLNNHVVIAAMMVNLITIRYEIIKNYRSSTLAILGAATARLGATETVTETTALGNVWMAVTGSGTAVGVVGDAMSLIPAVKEAAAIYKLVGSGLRMLGWTGSNFAQEFNIQIEQYQYSPEDVVIGLLDEIQGMKDSLEASETEYSEAARAIREVVNSVPSELLELYNFSRNQAE